MRELSLIIKQKWFDEIVAGTKKVETRELRANIAHRYIEYVDDATGKVYKKDTDIPEDNETAYARPIKYDALRLYVGYNKDRDSCLVEVTGAEIVTLVDEEDNEIVYEYQGREYVAALIEYQLGRVLEVNRE
jgi:hypothetical protein